MSHEARRLPNEGVHPVLLANIHPGGEGDPQLLRSVIFLHHLQGEVQMVPSLTTNSHIDNGAQLY